MEYRDIEQCRYTTSIYGVLNCISFLVNVSFWFVHYYIQQGNKIINNYWYIVNTKPIHVYNFFAIANKFISLFYIAYNSSPDSKSIALLILKTFKLEVFILSTIYCKLPKMVANIHVSGMEAKWREDRLAQCTKKMSINYYPHIQKKALHVYCTRYKAQTMHTCTWKMHMWHKHVNNIYMYMYMYIDD